MKIGDLRYLVSVGPHVLLITKVILSGQLVLSATTGADGGDAVGSDNAIELRANVPAGRPGLLTPPRPRRARPRLELLPSSVSCSVGVDGVARAVSAVMVDRRATVSATARSRLTGRVLWSLSGSTLGAQRLGATATKVSTVIAGPATVQLALGIAARPEDQRPCAIMITVTAKAPGTGRSRLRFRAG